MLEKVKSKSNIKNTSQGRILQYNYTTAIILESHIIYEIQRHSVWTVTWPPFLNFNLLHRCFSVAWLIHVIGGLVWSDSIQSSLLLFNCFQCCFLVFTFSFTNTVNTWWDLLSYKGIYICSCTTVWFSLWILMLAANMFRLSTVYHCLHILPVVAWISALTPNLSLFLHSGLGVLYCSLVDSE